MIFGFRVLTAVAGGLSDRQAGERFGVSAASVSQWRALERERGEARARSSGWRPQVRTGLEGAAKDNEVLAPYRSNAGCTAIEELRQALADKGVSVGYGERSRRFFARHAITRKKTAHGAEQDRPRHSEAARGFLAFDGQLDRLDPERLVFNRRDLGF